MSKTNLVPLLSKWTFIDYSDTGTDTWTVNDTGDEGVLYVSNESSRVYYKMADPSSIRGHKLTLTIDYFGSDDGASIIEFRFYNSDSSSYDKMRYCEDDGDYTAGAIELEVEMPTECGQFRLTLGHDYDSDGIDPPATITIKNVVLIDQYEESLYTLNFHKVLAENLPNSVVAGTQHIYFTTDGTAASMYIANKEGYLIPVGSTSSSSSSSSSEEEYTNAYTQQYIDERIDEILALQRAGDTFTFTVPTDIHVRIEDGDAGRYNQVRDYVLLSKQIPLDYICCCGDIMSYMQTWTAFEPRIEKVKNIFNQANCPWFATRGNHDYNNDDNGWASNSNIIQSTQESVKLYGVTNAIWHRSITRNLPVTPDKQIHYCADYEKYGFFYVDDYANKHRLIFTNSEETIEKNGELYWDTTNDTGSFAISGSCQTKRQAEWFVNEALDMTGKTDWVVSFYSHTVPYTDGGESNSSGDCSIFHGYGWNEPQLRNVIKAFQNGTVASASWSVYDEVTDAWEIFTCDKDFSSQGPIAVIGWFGGHIHDDCYDKVDGLNISVQTCTCSSQRSSWGNDPTPSKMSPERNSSTLACSMNVYVVNKDTRTVNMIKVGSKRDNSVTTSSDLTFTY